MPIRKRKISYTLNLEKELKDVPKGKRAKATREAGEVARQSILDRTNGLSSPVSGGRYNTRLSKKYREKKTAMGKGGVPNLRLDEKMLNSIRVDGTKKDFTLKITDALEKKKASGHNKGDYTASKKDLRRQFLPDDSIGEKFKRDIKTKILNVLKKYKERE